MDMAVLRLLGTLTREARSNIDSTERADEDGKPWCTRLPLDGEEVYLLFMQ